MHKVDKVWVLTSLAHPVSVKLVPAAGWAAPVLSSAPEWCAPARKSAPHYSASVSHSLLQFPSARCGVHDTASLTNTHTHKRAHKDENSLTQSWLEKYSSLENYWKNNMESMIQLQLLFCIPCPEENDSSLLLSFIRFGRNLIEGTWLRDWDGHCKTLI